MGKRKFKVEFSGEVTFELDDAVINVVDDEWRESLYNLHTPEEIAQHIAYNIVANHAELSHLDGWADQPDTNMKVLDGGVDWYDWEVKEIK